MNDTSKPKSSKPKKLTREERLAAQMRENLKKRKAAARKASAAKTSD
jgi:hypothetical protein